MNIKEIDRETFAQLFDRSAFVYNTTAFTELNRPKADEVIYLAAGDDKVIGGIVLGRRGDMLSSPFSAPYGGLVVNSAHGILSIMEVWEAITRYAFDKNCGLKITLPPAFMENGLTVRSENALLQLGGLPSVELNYHFDLTVGDIRDAFSGAGRKNLRRAERAGYECVMLDPTSENIERVYRIIAGNREAHGYDISMSLADVLATSAVATVHLFVLRLGAEEIAAAYLHVPVSGIAQVIYWGDIPGYSESRPMNMLAFRIFEFYRTKGYRVVDVGTSNIDGHPNYGLCDFKEGLGCRPTAKFTFLFPCESRRPRK